MVLPQTEVLNPGGQAPDDVLPHFLRQTGLQLLQVQEVLQELAQEQHVRAQDLRIQRENSIQSRA